MLKHKKYYFLKNTTTRKDLVAHISIYSSRKVAKTEIKEETLMSHLFIVNFRKRASW